MVKAKKKKKIAAKLLQRRGDASRSEICTVHPTETSGRLGQTEGDEETAAAAEGNGV